MRIEYKVGLISCSGEGLPEGMISRVATRRTLEQRDDVVTICLPLFLAGGQEERDFAKENPCITIDGCEKMCAAKGVKMYGKVQPKSSIIVTEIMKKGKHANPTSKSRIELQDENLVKKTMKAIIQEIEKIKEEEK